MFKKLHFNLVLFSLLTASVAEAGTCLLQLKSAAIRKSGSPIWETDLGEKTIRNVDDWHDCYEKAIHEVSLYEPYVLADVKLRLKKKNVRTYFFRWVDWKFYRGFSTVFSPRGQVNKYTSQFINSPLRGDLRFNRFGYDLFF